MDSSEQIKATAIPPGSCPPEPRHVPEAPAVEPRLTVRNVDDLHVHSSYVHHRLSVSSAQLSRLAEAGEEAFREPLVITHNGTIIDGHARLELARLQSRTTLPCLEYDLTDPQALEKLIQMHRRSNGVNDFSRILLALDLEPELKEKARQNQSLGGQSKGSSNLTKASTLDVRSEIAKVAGVSVGNVTKVKRILVTAHTDVIKALKERELSIHRAWSWCNLSPEDQKNLLWELQSSKGLRKVIRELISKHQSEPAPTATSTPLNVTALLDALNSGNLGSIRVVPIKAPIEAIFVTEKLLRSLQPQREFPFNAL